MCKISHASCVKLHLYRNVCVMISSLELRGSARGWQSVFHFENISVRYFLGSNWGSLTSQECLQELLQMDEPLLGGFELMTLT